MVKAVFYRDDAFGLGGITCVSFVPNDFSAVSELQAFQIELHSPHDVLRFRGVPLTLVLKPEEHFRWEFIPESGVTNGKHSEIYSVIYFFNT